MKLTNKLNHDITRLLLHYGPESQKQKSIEELNELIEAIENDSNVCEEIADVYVMLEQLKRIYKINDMEVVEIMKTKVKRQHKRIFEGEEK